MTESAHPVSFFFFLFLFSRPVHFKSSEHEICRKLSFYICAKVAPKSAPFETPSIKVFLLPRGFTCFVPFFLFFFYHLALINNVCNLQRFRKDTQQQQRGDKHAWHREACQHRSIRRRNMSSFFFPSYPCEIIDLMRIFPNPKAFSK